MNSEIFNEEMLRRYLLDDVSDDERREIEERFLENDALFDEINALEDELHYEYKQNRLNAREQYYFERKFLQSPEDLEKSAFADAFLKATSEIAKKKSPVALKADETTTVSVWQTIAAFFNFNNSAMRFGLSAAVILLAFGLGFLMFKNAELRREMASLETNRNAEQSKREQQIAEKQRQQSELERQLADEKTRTEQNEKRIAEIESEREKLTREINEAGQKNQTEPIPQTSKTPIATAPRTYIALILSPGSFTRENGEGMKQIKISPAIKNLRLRLLSDTPEDFKTYRAALKTLDDDREIWRNQNINPRGKGEKKTFSLNIPANILQRADYEISFVGVRENGETEEITTYYFSVLK